MSAQAPLAEALVTATTGLVPAGPADVQVVDRPAWVAANLASFRRLLRPPLDRAGRTGWAAAAAWPAR